MKLETIMTRDVEVIRPDQTLDQAAVKMRALDIGLLPVCDGEKLVGTLTDRDITIRASAEGYDPTQTKVEEVMTRSVIYGSEQDDVEMAAYKMAENQVRRLPIVDENMKLVGIVSLGDLATRVDEDKVAGHVLKDVSENSV